MMRRFFLSVLVSAGCVTMQAAEVNQQKAQETAKAFMTQMMSQQAGTRRRKATRRKPITCVDSGCLKPTRVSSSRMALRS